MEVRESKKEIDMPYLIRGEKEGRAKVVNRVGKKMLKVNT